MTKPKFSHWVRWEDRDKLDGIRDPGVYALVVQKEDISNTKFNWIKKIKYFGMTRLGLKARLKQFENTIKGKTGHSGGERFRRRYTVYQKFIKKLFVSIWPIKCDINSNDPKELRKMGKIAYWEYFCFAEYAKRFKKRPKFNDNKNSPKK